MIGSYLEQCNNSKELLISCLIPPARCPLVFLTIKQAVAVCVLARGLPSISTIEVTTLAAIIHKRKPYREYVFRKVIINSNGAIKVWWGTKLRSHKKKDYFPNEQGNNNR